jgi:hypothetical protein
MKAAGEAIQKCKSKQTKEQSHRVERDDSKATEQEQVIQREHNNRSPSAVAGSPQEACPSKQETLKVESTKVAGTDSHGRHDDNSTPAKPPAQNVILKSSVWDTNLHTLAKTAASVIAYLPLQNSKPDIRETEVRKNAWSNCFCTQRCLATEDICANLFVPTSPA